MVLVQQRPQLQLVLEPRLMLELKLIIQQSSLMLLQFEQQLHQLVVPQLERRLLVLQLERPLQLVLLQLGQQQPSS